MSQIQAKNRALAEAQAAASPAAEQARSVVLACAEHQALMQQAAEVQVFRQNNTAVRCAPMLTSCRISARHGLHGERVEVEQ